jgi:hypothetical protein
MRRCPKCDSQNTRRSKRGLENRTLGQLFAVWFRCRDCSSRFLVTDWVLAAKWLGASGTLAGLTIALLWSSSRQSPSGAAGPTSTKGGPYPSSQPLPAVEFLLTDDAVQGAAERGDPEAQYRLGLELLQRFREDGDRQSLEAGISWVRRAAQQAHPRAQLVMGTQCLEGRGVIQDYAAAAEWYRKAANQGNPEAMLYLGQMTEGGKGVDADPVMAYVWLNLAAARGETRAEMIRERVRGTLSPEEVTQAQDRSRRMEESVPRPAAGAGQSR